MKTILNFGIPFEREDNEKFVSARFMEVVKDMKVSDILTVVSA